MLTFGLPYSCTVLGATLHRFIFSRLTRGESAVLKQQCVSSLQCCKGATVGVSINAQAFVCHCVWSYTLLTSLFLTHARLSLHISGWNYFFILHDCIASLISFWIITWADSLVYSLWFLSCKQNGINVIVFVIWCNVSLAKVKCHSHSWPERHEVMDHMVGGWTPCYGSGHCSLWRWSLLKLFTIFISCKQKRKPQRQFISMIKKQVCRISFISVNTWSKEKLV